MFLPSEALLLILLSTLMIKTHIQQQSLFGLYIIQVRRRRTRLITNTNDQMSELQVIGLFWFIPGCQCFPARLPELFGLCLETTKLQGCCSWGEHTSGDAWPLGLFWRVTEELFLWLTLNMQNCCASTDAEKIFKQTTMRVLATARTVAEQFYYKLGPKGLLDRSQNRVLFIYMLLMYCFSNVLNMS